MRISLEGFIMDKKLLLLVVTLCTSTICVPSQAASINTNNENTVINTTDTTTQTETIVRPAVSRTNTNTVQNPLLKKIPEVTKKSPQVAETVDAVTSGKTITTSEVTGKELKNARNYIFSDVPANYWAYNSIATMTEQKYISGYSDGTFKPDKAMSREEVASLFNKIIGSASPVILSSSFSDITSDRWSANAIEAVARLNIISGYGDKTYHPDENMSRQEFAVVADNYLHYLGYQTEDPTNFDNIAFSDQKFVAAWAQQPVKELAYLGFLSYNPRTLFNPEKYITRAEATELAYRLTNTKEAVALRNNILHQRVENKVENLLISQFGSIADFSQEGFTYWEDNKYIIAVKDKNKLKKVDANLTASTDTDLKSYVSTISTKYTQDYFDNLSTSAAKLYNQTAKHGKILGTIPNPQDGTLALIVDNVTIASQKAISQKLGHKVTLISPSAVPVANK